MPTPRWLLVLHRYLGVAVGLLMLVWCLSGAVMMFVRYPELTETQRVAGLPLIRWEHCCRFADRSPLAEGQPVSAAVVEDLAGTPIVRVQTSDGADHVLDLSTGAAMGRSDAGQALRVAEAFRQRTTSSILGKSPTLQVVDRDQWTVSGDFKPERPLYKVSLGDPADSELYVSSRTGHAVQLTTRSGRFWNWLGAVPHWLYPTILRSNGALWTQVVIWTSLVGCFLTLTGLYVGLAMLKRAPDRWSPYRKVWLWHHFAGLGFGVLTLAWVASGLVSVNPWGFLDSGPDPARTRVEGASPTWAAVRTALVRLAAHPPADLVSVSAQPFDGRLYLLGRTSEGGLLRLGPDAGPAPLTASDLAAAAARLASGRVMASAAPLAGEDAYYFRHHGPALAPAYRVILRDGGRYYLDIRTGALLRAVDANARGYRWLHQGLHRWDFVPGLHDGPVWAVLTLILLGGVTFGVGTGVYLGVGAVARDGRRLSRKVSGPPGHGG